MFGLKQKKKEEVKQVDTLDSLRKKFQEVKEIAPQKKEVILLYETCCGCGCHTSKISRMVDSDSPLRSGDYINDTIKGDKVVQ